MSSAKRVPDALQSGKRLQGLTDQLHRFRDCIRSGRDFDPVAVRLTVTELVEVVSELKTIPQDQSRWVGEMVDAIEELKAHDAQTGAIFKSENIIKIHQFYCHWAFKTTDRRGAAVVMGQILRSDSDQIRKTKQFFVTTAKLRAAEKVDWQSVFRVYVAVCLKNSLALLRDSADLFAGPFFPELFNDCNRFFFEGNFGEFLACEAHRSPHFKEAFPKSLRQKEEVDLIDILIFQYQCYVCSEMLGLFNRQMEERPLKLPLSVQDFFFRSWTQTLRRQIWLFEMLWEKQKEVIGADLPICHCETQHASDNAMYLGDQPLCGECILFGPEATKKTKAKPKGATKRREIQLTGNLNVLTVLFGVKLNRDDRVRVASFRENFEQGTLTADIESPAEESPEMMCLWEIGKRLCKINDVREIREVSNALLLLLTTAKNNDKFSYVKNQISRLLAEVPLVGLLPTFFRIFCLLQSATDPVTVDAVTEFYGCLAAEVDTWTLCSLSFRGKRVAQYLFDFFLSHASSEKVKIAKGNLMGLNRFVANGCVKLMVSSTFLRMNLSPVAVGLGISDHRLRDLELADDKKLAFGPKQIHLLANSFNKHDAEACNTTIECLYGLCFPSGPPEKDLPASGDKRPKPKSPNSYSLDLIQSLVRVLYLLDVSATAGKSETEWHAKLVDHIQTNRKGVLREFCNFAVENKGCFSVPAICRLLFFVFKNEKAIKNNGFLSEMAVILADLILCLIDPPRGAEDPNEPAAPIEITPVQTLNLLNQCRILTAILDTLNRNEINLFYKERLNQLHLFIAEHAFLFPLTVFQPIFKLKVKIDLNFQTIQMMESSLRKNANFLSLSIIEIRTEVDDQTEQTLNAELLCPIIKCVYAIRKMLELLPERLFNQNVRGMVLNLVLQLFQFECPQLTKEAFYTFPWFYSFGVLKPQVIFGIMDRLLPKPYGLNLVMKLTQKLIGMRLHIEFLGYVWRKYIDCVYEALDSSVGLRGPPDGSRTTLKVPHQNLDVSMALACLKNLAGIREVDLMVLYARAFAWLFAADRRISGGSAQLIRQLVVSDSRLAKNNSLGIEMSRNLIAGVQNNASIKNLVGLVSRQASHIGWMRGLGLENGMVEALLNNAGDYEAKMETKTETHLTKADVLLFSVLLMNEESIRLDLVGHLVEGVNRLLHKSAAQFVVVKRQLEQPPSDLTEAQALEFYSAPIHLLKLNVYLFFFNSLMMNAIHQSDEALWEKRREYLAGKSNWEISKLLRDSLTRRNVSAIEVPPQIYEQLADRLDKASMFGTFGILKKGLSRIQNKPFIEMFEKDAFNHVSDAQMEAKDIRKTHRRSKRPSSVSKTPPKVSKPKRKTMATTRTGRQPIKDDDPDTAAKRYNFRTTAKRTGRD